LATAHNWLTAKTELIVVFYFPDFPLLSPEVSALALGQETRETRIDWPAAQWLDVGSLQTPSHRPKINKAKHYNSPSWLVSTVLSTSLRLFFFEECRNCTVKVKKREKT
jgi:hypothetical protein